MHKWWKSDDCDVEEVKEKGVMKDAYQGESSAYMLQYILQDSNTYRACLKSDHPNQSHSPLSSFKPSSTMIWQTMGVVHKNCYLNLWILPSKDITEYENMILVALPSSEETSESETCPDGQSCHTYKLSNVCDGLPLICVSHISQEEACYKALGFLSMLFWMILWKYLSIVGWPRDIKFHQTLTSTSHQQCIWQILTCQPWTNPPRLWKKRFWKYSYH